MSQILVPEPLLFLNHKALTGMKYLAFSLDNNLGALDCSHILEILPFMHLDRPATAPTAILGLLPREDNAVPVLNLPKLLGKGEPQNKLTSHIIVAELKNRRLAYLVDRVTGFVDLDDRSCTPVSEDNSFNGCVTARHGTGDNVVHIFAPEKILSQQEQEQVEAFRQMAEERLQTLRAPPEKKSKRKVARTKKTTNGRTDNR